MKKFFDILNEAGLTPPAYKPSASYFRSVLRKLTKMPPARLDYPREFAKYGLDLNDVKELIREKIINVNDSAGYPYYEFNPAKAEEFLPGLAAMLKGPSSVTSPDKPSTGKPGHVVLGAGGLVKPLAEPKSVHTIFGGSGLVGAKPKTEPVAPKGHGDVKHAEVPHEDHHYMTAKAQGGMVHCPVCATDSKAAAGVIRCPGCGTDIKVI